MDQSPVTLHIPATVNESEPLAGDSAVAGVVAAGVAALWAFISLRLTRRRP